MTPKDMFDGSLVRTVSPLCHLVQARRLQLESKLYGAREVARQERETFAKSMAEKDAELGNLQETVRITELRWRATVDRGNSLQQELEDERAARRRLERDLAQAQTENSQQQVAGR